MQFNLIYKTSELAQPLSVVLVTCTDPLSKLKLYQYKYLQVVQGEEK